jgi:hypothetical protein
MKYDALKKGAIGGLMALTLMTAVAPTPQAHAATLEELQAQIQVLMAQIAALNGQTTGATVGATFTRDLTIGHSGAEVTALQQFLIKKGFSIPAGATGYFGEQTRAALAQYQAANAITPAAGYFGPITRTKVNAQSAVVVVPPPSNNNGGNNNGGSTNTPLQGEGELENFRVLSGDDTNLEEGESGLEVMEFSFDADNGDVKINRIDLGFTPGSGNDETDPWDVFDEISIWDGNTRIAKIDTSNDENWKENSPSNGSYMLRISGLSYIVKEDKTADLTVKVETQNGIRGVANGESWELFIPDNGIRGVDADNASVYIGDTSETVVIDIDEAGTEDELIVKRSDSDLDATTLQLKDDARSGYLTVFEFDLDTDDSARDIEIRKLPIELTVDASTVGTFMRDARIKVDGKTYTKKTVTDGATNTIVFEFARGEFVIDSGDRVTVEVQVEFKPLASQYEGTTLVASVDTNGIVAKGADDLDGNQLSGSATSETHTLGTKGMKVEVADLSSEVTSVTGQDNDYATYTIELDVTAFGQDVYVPVNVTDAIQYQLEDSSGNALSASSTAILSSNARTANGYYRIAEGDTKTITIDVTYRPGTSLSSARLQLLSIAFNDEAAAPSQTWNAQPSSSYETATKTIVD